MDHSLENTEKNDKIQNSDPPKLIHLIWALFFKRYCFIQPLITSLGVALSVSKKAIPVCTQLHRETGSTKCDGYQYYSSIPKWPLALVLNLTVVIHDGNFLNNSAHKNVKKHSHQRSLCKFSPSVVSLAECRQVLQLNDSPVYPEFDKHVLPCPLHSPIPLPCLPNPPLNVQGRTSEDHQLDHLTIGL